MMLEQLSIQNFQAHSKTKIDLDPNITTIIGPSDVGKSAIIRALRWACTNTPGGGDFVRHGEKGATVRVVADGHKISRKRSARGTENEYHLDDKEYKAFGRDVPEPIQDVLNIGPTSWQGQHDAPYWFSNTAGEVSRQLNDIVNLGIIDDVLGAMVSNIQKHRWRLQQAEEALTKANDDYVASKWADKFEMALQYVEGVKIAWDAIGRDRFNLTQFIEQSEQYEQTREKADSVAAAGRLAVERYNTLKRCEDDINTLTSLVQDATKFRKLVRRAVPDMTPVVDARAELNQVRRKIDSISAVINEADEKEKTLCQAEKALEEARKAMPKVCPTCKRSL